ncbi:MAG TPA: RNA polymerase factor sigma-54 [Rhodomicrobium sp.]|nr:RNA polymerase factor sigma-54 [Rhodomicrobium sp.]
MLQLRLETRQTQKIVITPQLRQAIKLLQLSAIELQSYIENEVRENPLLSAEERPDNESAPEGLPEIAARANGEADIPAFDARDVNDIEINTDWEPETPGDRVLEGEPAAPSSAAVEWSSAGSSSLSSGEDYDPFATIASAKSLADHLDEQACLAFTTAQNRLIARYLIDLVDIDGYIRNPLEDVAASLSTSLKDIERVLITLQTFDPPGICARDLAECLALQLKEKDRFDPFMERLLANLDLIAACDFQRLKKVCGVDADDLREMIGELRQLNPRPGRAFDRAEIETLVPDVIVRRAADGEWRAELNPGAAPSLAVDRAYYASLKARCRSDADRTYLNDRLSSANWLVKSLEQRLATILKVATAVVEEQTAFLDHGVRHLKPLNLRQIATKIGMHESTVSRVTSNKAMATPRGIFEMKYFFTSAIPASGASDAHSSEAVRDRIKEFILNESPAEILSDDRIVTLLKADGIDIARRTVAKYREALRIPSSAARRRQKRAASAA